MISLHRRRFAELAMAAAATGTGAVGARAQVSGLELFAPSSPGSGYDQLARTMQAVLTSTKLASGIQVQNVPGGGGTVGLAQYANGKRRGPSLLVFGFALVGGILTTKAPVSLDGLVPVARLVGEDDVLVVPAASDIRTLADLVAKLKANPPAVRWAGGSIGGIDHVLVGLIAKTVGVDPTKVNYVVHAGGSEVMASTLGGRVTVGVSGFDEFRSLIKAGKLRAIAVSGEARIEGLDAPTLKEGGVDLALVNWRGAMTHPDADAADRAAVAAMVAAMARTPEWKDALEKRGWSDLYLGPAEFTSFLKAETARVGAALRDVGLLK